MCGATQAQTNLQNAQTAAYTQAQQMTQEQYAQQQSIYGPMKTQFDSIFQKGPNQQGFSSAELGNLNSQAVEGTAQNYAGAAKATNDALASEGGGSNPMPTGAQEEMKQNVADTAAQSESQQESTIQSADYAQGYNEWSAAAGGLQAIASGVNPLGFENAATAAGSAASTTANDIASQQNSITNAAIGAVGAIGGGLASCPAKGSAYRMFDGSLKKVEDLMVGDLLMGIGCDPQIIEEIQTGLTQVIRVETEDGHVARNSLTHAFALQHGGFAVASKSLGKKILTDGAPSEVIRVDLDGIDLVFNVITDGSHTYCADGLWALGVGDAERRVSMDTWNKIGAAMTVRDLQKKEN